jgi:hypothetical protein
MLAVACASRAPATAQRLISESAIGGIGIGMTLDSVRRAFPEATFERTEDGDGAQFVAVMLGTDATVVTWLDESDPVGPIDFAQSLKQLETFDSTFATPEGVHVGSRVADVEKVYGKTVEIMLSEIESRQFIRFERQPSHLTFRLDYSGEFPEGAHRTTRYAADARIFSIAVSRR